MGDLPDPDLTAASQPRAVPSLNDSGDVGPLFVIPHNAAAGRPGTPKLVEVGEETIQIAPHPTTNRFPWSPVDNPTIPVYKTVNIPGEPIVQAVLPSAPAPAPPPVVARRLLPTKPEPLPTPVATVPPAPEPPEQPPVALTPPIQMVPQSVVRQPIGLPVSPPPPKAPQVAPKLVEPVPEHVAHPDVPPPPAYDNAPLPPAPDLSVSSKQRIVGSPVHIYSESTRRVWKINRGGHGVKIFWTVVVITFIIGGLIFWSQGWSLNSIFDLPVLQPIFHAQ